MSRIHSKLGDSDDDLEDLPLKYISPNHYKVLSIKELKRSSVHACDFCDASFKNRYDYLIHNAKHIIIPLIKMLPHYCAECNLYCLSDEEIKEHMTVKHQTIGKRKLSETGDCKTKITDRFNFEVEDIKEEPNEDDIPLTMVKKEISKDDETENVLQNFVMNCKVDVEKFLPPLLCNSNFNSNNVVDTWKLEKKPVVQIRPCIELSHTMQNEEASLKIEPDVKTSIHNDILKSEEDYFKNPMNDPDPTSDFSDLDDDPITILVPVKEESTTECKQDSVHFDDLMKPGIFYCKRCFMRFPNRFEVIVHEAVHLDLSRTAPEGLRQERSLHPAPLASGTFKTVKTCDRCFEAVSDEKLHAKTCYKLHCSACAKGFHTRAYLTAHENTCNGEAVVNMCDTCLYHREKPKHIRYFGISRLYKPKKETCHWCGKLSEDVSMVTIISKKRLIDRIRFEGEEKEVPVDSPQSPKKRKKGIKAQKNGMNKQTGCVPKILSKAQKNGMNERTGRVPKILSNRERLKLIQMRLKMMKK